MASLILTRASRCIRTHGAVSVGLPRLLRGKETFKDYVSEHAVHEAVVDVDQNARRLRFDDADVVDAA